MSYLQGCIQLFTKAQISQLLVFFMKTKLDLSLYRYSIAKNLTPLKCSTCFNQFHSSCGGIKVKDYNKLNNWDCNKCLSGNLPFSGIGDEIFKLTLLGKDSFFTDNISLPSFSIQSLLDKFPGSFSCEDFSFENGTSKYYTPSEFLNRKFKNNSFSLLHINIVSLSAHIDDLKVLLDCLDHPFDLIGISETKIKIDNEPLIDIYLFQVIPLKIPQLKALLGELDCISKILFLTKK